jgi:CBS domain containing-hemolysin-like protein
MSESTDSGHQAEGRAPTGPREQSAGLFDRLRALLGLTPASIRDDIEDAIDESASAEFTPQERAILKNVLALHDVRVADVMVPRADVVALALDTPLRDVLDLFRTAGHSRLPVYQDTLDDPRGMIHIRDFVVFLASDPRFGLKPAQASSDRATSSGLDMPLSEARILRPVLYAPPSMPALDLLLRMQASHTHMALVIDEYGGTDGLVAI